MSRPDKQEARARRAMTGVMNAFTTQAAKAVRSVGIGALSGSDMADCAAPDSPTSPGARLLESVRDAVAESIEYGEPKSAEDLRRHMDDSSATHEIADGAPSVYTHQRWQEFLDLGAYSETPEPASGGEDMTTLAGYVLYQIAKRLVHALVEYAIEECADARPGRSLMATVAQLDRHWLSGVCRQMAGLEQTLAATVEETGGGCQAAVAVLRCGTVAVVTDEGAAAYESVRTWAGIDPIESTPLWTHDWTPVEALMPLYESAAHAAEVAVNGASEAFLLHD